LQYLPPAMKAVLEDLRQTIKAAAPEAQEVISYQLPTYKYKGAVVHFGAFKNHCSLFGVSKNIIELFKDELTPFKTETTTLHFTPDNPIPADLVQRIVRLRVKQNEDLAASKKHAKTLQTKK
jgi:uncharacterized protein YdhG (YjbR/CyaY superfamily)